MLNSVRSFIRYNSLSMTSKLRPNEDYKSQQNTTMSIYKIKEMLDTMKAKKNTVHFFVKYEESFVCFAFGFTSSLPSALRLITREVISTSKSIDDSGADVDVVGLAAVDVVGLEAVEIVGLEAVDTVGLAPVGVVCLVTVDVDVVVLVKFSDSRAVLTIDVVSVSSISLEFRIPLSIEICFSL